MSNYTPIVNYAPKDALSTGDPAKLIKGVELAAEFTAIASMSSTKEDISNKGIANGYAPLNASILLADSYLTTNIPRIDGATIAWTGAHTFSRAATEGVGGRPINLHSANPAISWFYTNGGTNQKGLWIGHGGGSYSWYRLNDDNTFGRTVLTLTYNDGGYSNVSWGNATDNPTFTLVGTGALITGGNIELGHASDTTLSRASAGVLAVEGNNVLTTATGLIRGLRTIPITAAAMQPATTNGASQANVEAASGVLYKTLDFDTSTQEFAGFVIPMPKSWNDGTITFQVIWTFATGSAAQTVDWALEAVAISDDDPISATFGTAVVVTDTAIAAGDVHISAVSSALTVGGSPSNGDLVAFRIKRNVSTDNLGGDARLIALRIFYTENASDDT